MTELEQLQLMVKGTGNRYAIQSVASALLSMTDDELELCPSRVALGQRAGVTERSVRRAVRHLVALGAIREEVRPRNTRRLHLDVPRLAAIAGLL